MISGDLKFEGFDALSWTNLISLFAPGVIDRLERDASEVDAQELTAGDEHRRAGTLLVVTDEDRDVLAAIHSLHGRVPDLVDASDPTALLDRYDARRCVVMRDGAMEELSERLALRMRRSDDYVTQGLTLFRVARELMDSGQISLTPNPLGSIPTPSPAAVRRALDLVIPDEHALVFVLFDAARPNVPFTALAIRRRRGAIDWVVGPDIIRSWTGPLGGDWRRDYRVYVNAVEREIGPVHLGLFAEASTVRRLMRRPDPGAWIKSAAVRDLIIHPTPPYVAVALGADGVRAVASKSAELLGGMDLFQNVAPVARFLRGQVKEIASVTSVLGFNPLKLLAQLLDRDPDEAETD